MGILYKQGVLGQDKIHPMLQKAKGRVEKLYREAGEDMVVTSVLEGTHSSGSFHEIGRAIDFRHGSPSEKEIREAAGVGFDFVFHTDHIHMEYDPK